jgi:acetyl esterase/lipase
VEAAWTPPDDVITRPAPPPDLVLSYGSGPGDVADVRLPPKPRGGAPGGEKPRGDAARQAARGEALGGEAARGEALSGEALGGEAQPAPLVVFLHGGFWRATHDRAHTGPMGTALAAAGYAVCVPEFRRTGQPGGGWPGTFDDVAVAVDRTPALVRQAAGPGVIAEGPVLLAGHSAGGHLALWAAARHLLDPGSPWHTAQPCARGVVVLAGVTSLAECYEQGMGDGAAAALMGGGPGQHPQRYRDADPAGLLPLGRPVRLVHGALDDVVPMEMSRGYAARGRAAGDDTALVELPGASHVDLIDPLSPAWPHVVAAFGALGGPG